MATFASDIVKTAGADGGEKRRQREFIKKHTGIKVSSAKLTPRLSILQLISTTQVDNRQFEVLADAPFHLTGPQVEEARQQVPEEPLEVIAFGGPADLVVEADEATRLQQVGTVVVYIRMGLANL